MSGLFYDDYEEKWAGGRERLVDQRKLGEREETKGEEKIQRCCHWLLPPPNS